MENYPLWTAVVTPMNEDSNIDYESFKNVLRKQEEAGIGIVVLGSTGEGLNLNAEEKKKVVLFSKSLSLSVPLMAGVGGFLIDTQIEFIHFCDEVGVDALLLVAPMYAKPGVNGQIKWFEQLFEETKTPCMIYNVPSRTGIKMDPAVPAHLYKKYSHYMGLKEASGSLKEFKAFADVAPGAKLYCGDDSLIQELVAAGAVGHVSVASNAWPKITMKYLQLNLEGKTELLYKNWVADADKFFDAPSPIPVKTLMQHKGWIANNEVRTPLSLDDLKSETEEGLLDADINVNAWFASLK